MTVQGLNLMKSAFSKYGINFLPSVMTPDFLIKNVETLIKVMGAVMVASSLLIIAGYRFPTIILIGMLTSFNVLVHNPYLESNKDMKAL